MRKGLGSRYARLARELSPPTPGLREKVLAKPRAKRGRRGAGAGAASSQEKGTSHEAAMDTTPLKVERSAPDPAYENGANKGLYR